MRWLTMAALAVLSACSSGGGPKGPTEDYSTNFTGYWSGTVGGTFDGTPVTPSPGWISISRLGTNRLSLANVCPDGSPATAQVTGPTTLSMEAMDCPPIFFVDCASVVLHITSASATLSQQPQGPLMNLVEDGSMSGCGHSAVVHVTFGAFLQRGPFGIDRLVPSAAMVGGPGFVLLVGGGGFTQDAVVSWNGTPRPTTYLTPAALQATISASDLATPGTAQVTVTVPGAGTAGPFPFEVAVPVPVATALTPSSALRGGPALEVVVTGNTFERGAVVTWNGSPRATTFVSAGELHVQVEAADLALATVASLVVTLPLGGASSPLDFTVLNPPPLIASLGPAGATEGDPAMPLGITGSGFVPESVVRWAGAARATTFLSETALRIDLAAADLALPGAFDVTVESPAPGGGTSPPATFQVGYLTPVITAIAPGSGFVGQGGLTVTLWTQHALAGTVVHWNGAPRRTVEIAPGVLEVFLDPADLASPGGGQLTLHTPPPASGASGVTWFIVDYAPMPPSDAVSWQVDPAHDGHSFAGWVFNFPDPPTWTAALGQRVSYPLVVGSRVFVLTVGDPGGASGSFLQALDLATGAPLWAPVEIPGGLALAGHAYDGGQVFVLRSDGQLYAFDAATGAQHWSVALASQSTFTSPPVADGGMVYLTGPYGLFAVAALDGSIRWSTFTQAASGSAPTLSPDGVYLGGACRTSKFNRFTGTLLWQVDLGCSGGGGATPVWSAGNLYVMDRRSSEAGSIYDAYDGTRLRPLDFSLFFASAPVADDAGTVFFLGGGLQARDRDALVLQWSFAGDGALAYGPVLVNGLVLVGSASGTVYAVERYSGVERWRGSAGVVPPNVPAGPPIGIAAAQGTLLAPAGGQLTAWRISGP